MISKADMVKVSEEELALLYGKNLSYEEGAAQILSEGTSLVLVTLGSKGVFYAARTPNFTESGIVPAKKVSVVDTTGAGDSFNGGLLYRLSQKENPFDFTKEGIESDLGFANAVAALCVTKRGAIPALPALSEVEVFQRKESK